MERGAVHSGSGFAVCPNRSRPLCLAEHDNSAAPAGNQAAVVGLVVVAVVVVAFVGKAAGAAEVDDLVAAPGK